MMKRVLLVLGMVWAGSINAQSLEYGSLVAHVDSVIDGMPKSPSGGQYVAPDGLSRYAWKTLFQDLLAEQYVTAADKAAQLGYRLVCFTDTSDGSSTRYYLLERQRDPGAPHWGLFVVNPLPLRPNLVIQSPHPRYDLNTGRQGVRVFTRTGARVFFISGTHRCNSPEYSSCDGSTAVCGTSEPHRLSDQPHTVTGTFQATTEVLQDRFTDLIYVQLHGFAQRENDPDIIMSNTHYGKPPVDYLAILRDALHVVDPDLTFKIAHLDNWTYLTATTNMQGRYVNGVLNPCNTSAKKNTGRFLHLEQAYNKLRDSAENWDKMAQALMIAFPAQPAGVTERPQRVPALFHLAQNHPNPFNQQTLITYRLDRAAWCDLSIHDVKGGQIKVLVSGPQAAGENHVRWTGRDDTGRPLPSGVYLYRLRANGTMAQGKMLLLR